MRPFLRERALVGLKRGKSAAKNGKRNPRMTQHAVLSPVTGQDVCGIHLPLEKSELPGGESPLFEFATTSNATESPRFYRKGYFYYMSPII
ncbi:MAG TPA: hypothetical protein VF026_31320 [Ktedonobacteraceae bacterium]